MICPQQLNCYQSPDGNSWWVLAP